MATYISLVNLTQQGIRYFEDAPRRAATFEALARRAGVTIDAIYWTMGAYDAVILMDAPDDESAAAVVLALEAAGNMRTQTLRAFAPTEVEKIIALAPGL